MVAATAESAPVDAPKPTGAGLRSTLPKGQRKFQRYDRESAGPERPTATPSPDAADDGEPLPEGAAPTVIPASAPERSMPSYAGRPVPIALTGGPSNRRAKPVPERSPYLWVGMQVGAIFLLGLMFYMGRISVPKAVAPVKDAAPTAPRVAPEGATLETLSPEAANLIDQAMAAEQDRQFAKATDLLKQVQRNFPGIRDLDYHLALLALEENDAVRALPLLNQSIAEGEQPGASYKLRGTVLSRRGGVNRGMNDFENATLADPFGAENFFFWGEALRRAGKMQAALVKLQQAIDRLRVPELENQYRLQIRLTQLELGQEQAFAAEMAEQLAQNPPVPDWLLTAAAVELHRNNFPAAAGYLDKASTYMDKELFELRLRDFFFYGYRFQKPLERFFTFAKTAPTPTPSTAIAATPAPGLPEPPALLPESPAPSPAVLPVATP